MVATKYDYSVLERQYVYGTMSLRQLCRDNDIKTWSTVSQYARNHDWDGKRERIAEQQQAVEIKTVVEARAARVAKMMDDAIAVANQALFAFSDSLRDRLVEVDGKSVLIPAQHIPPADFVKIFEKVMVLNGQVTNREAHLSMEISPDQLSMEVLRDLADAARALGADTKPVQSSPLPRLEGPRQVN